VLYNPPGYTPLYANAGRRIFDMTLNFPGPYAVEIAYTVDGLTHTQTVNCDVTNSPAPGSLFSDCTVQKKGGGTDDLDALVDEWIDLLAAVCPDDITFTTGTLWEYTPESFDRRWIADYSIGVAGDGGDPYTPASEYIWTFRTQEGGNMQIRLEEVTISAFGKTAAGAIGGAPGAVVDYLVGDGGWILARDTSYPVVGLYVLRGQNEAIFKKRYR
jgi:hypothetical protein